MATTPVTFTLDDVSLRHLQDAAEKLALSRSEIGREAIGAFHDPIRRLSERERTTLLRAFDNLVPRIPPGSAPDAAREIAAIRAARRTGDRATAPGQRL